MLIPAHPKVLAQPGSGLAPLAKIPPAEPLSPRGGTEGWQLRLEAQSWACAAAVGESFLSCRCFSSSVFHKRGQESWRLKTLLPCCYHLWPVSSKDLPR